MGLQSDSTLSLAKISRPKLPVVLQRQRLFNQIDENLNSASLWLVGPAGSGKTTLINSYLDARGLPCIWYRFDGRDSEVANFFYYLGKVAETLAEEGDPLPLLTPEYSLDIPTFAQYFFEQFFTRLMAAKSRSSADCIAVVFDDYHLIAPDSLLHQLIKLALADAPQGIGLIFLSRVPYPQDLTPLQANRSLSVIGWEDLRLTSEETADIARLIAGQSGDKLNLQQLHETAQGWVAGLILLLEGIKSSGQIENWPGNIPALIPDYFRESVFNGLAESIRGFLLKSACLPIMTAAMAVRLTGQDKAAILLEKLHRENFFTEKRNTAEPTYLYHALFREFLLAQAECELTEVELQQTRRMAGLLLEEAGYIEQAAETYLSMQDWNSLARLVIGNAPTLLQQGRSQLLESWLRAIPSENIAASPWLLYWLGSCNLFSNPLQAREYLQTAFHQFTDTGDRAGQFLSWAAVIDTGTMMWEFHFLKEWIAVMEKLLAQDEHFPSPEIAARVTTGMFTALMFSEPWHDKISNWVARLEQCIQNCQNIEQKLQMSMFLVPYYSWVGRLQDMQLLVDSLKPASFESIRPLAQLLWCLPEANFAWFMADWERSLQAVNTGLKIGTTSGARIMDTLMNAQGAYALLGKGDLEGGKRYLDRIQAMSSEQSNVNRAHYYYISAWHSALSGRYQESISALNAAMKMACHEESPFPAACNHVELAGVLIETGDLKQAEAHLRDAENIAFPMHSHTMVIKCQLVRARLALKRGDNEVACTALRKAFGKMREGGFVYLPWWCPGVMAELCVKALEHDIETEYVRDLVRRHSLVPSSPPVHLENWPWALKIYTLGRFAIIKDDKSLSMTGKAQQMPLFLLKALITLGGRSVAESKLTEILWPDADADTAHSAFTTTLYRLRKLLGHAEALWSSGGRLSLNASCCWVDVWGFERAIGKADTTLHGAAAADDQSLEQGKQALGLYHGGFLPDEDADEYAIFSARERLRDKYLRLVEHLGAQYIGQGRYAEAITCYEKGLEVDDLVEPFYQKLMTCYQHNGYHAKTQQLYEKCQQTLKARFGIEPSRETQALYQSLQQRPGEAR